MGGAPDLAAMTTLIRLAVLAAVLFAAWTFGVPAYAQWRIDGALREAGVRDQVATCIAGRMAGDLSPLQLWSLRSLQGEKATMRDWLDAVGRIEDPQVLRVAGQSAALCSSGLAR